MLGKDLLTRNQTISWKIRNPQTATLEYSNHCRRARKLLPAREERGLAMAMMSMLSLPAAGTPHAARSSACSAMGLALVLAIDAELQGYVGKEG
jgi:hypothetical protein